MKFFRFVFYSFLVLATLAYIGYKKWGGDHSSNVDIQLGSGPVLTETNIADFDAVEIHGAFEVVLSEENSSKYVIETTESMMEKVKARIKGNTLIISTEKWPKRLSKVKVIISAPEYRSILISGTAQVQTDGSITGEALTLRMSGASDGELSLNAESLNVQNSGASDLELQGDVKEVKISISGAGEVDAEELLSKHMNISISGAGHASVHAEEKLSIHVSGAGSVRYYGDPDIIDQHISGVGSVKQAE